MIKQLKTASGATYWRTFPEKAKRFPSMGTSVPNGVHMAHPTPLPLDRGPAHYRGADIEPIEFILAQKLDFCEGNVVKYVTRWKQKDGIADLKKARDYLDFLIKREENRTE
jgi:hypothetical protein